MGAEELKWRQLAHNLLFSPQGSHFSPLSTAIKAQISGRMVSSGTSVVAFASVYRISSNSFRGIYSFQVLPAAATKRGRLLNEGGYY